jgi:hypothetical protein
MSGEEPPGPHPLSAADIDRIAQAFELSNTSVLLDRSLLDGWRGSEFALLAALRERHQWDPTIAPYYLYWLRGRVGDPPSNG